jgi:hypothetical protein
MFPLTLILTQLSLYLHYVFIESWLPVEGGNTLLEPPAVPLPPVVMLGEFALLTPDPSQSETFDVNGLLFADSPVNRASRESARRPGDDGVF